MEKAELIKALRNVKDEYRKIDFEAVNTRIEDALAYRGKTQDELAAAIGYAPSRISELKKECDEYNQQPADGKLELFFRKLELIALALDVSPIWLKYNIGEMDNNAISFDEAEKDAATDATKKDAAAVKDSAAPVPIRCDLDIENSIRAISSALLSLSSGTLSFDARYVSNKIPVEYVSSSGRILPREELPEIVRANYADFVSYDDEFTLEIRLHNSDYSSPLNEEFTPFDFIEEYFKKLYKICDAREMLSSQEMEDKALDLILDLIGCGSHTFGDYGQIVTRRKS